MDNWQARETAMIKAREAIGDGATFGTITVAYDSDYWAYSSVWIKATCKCGALVMSWGSHPRDLRFLADSVARYWCPKFGHTNAVDTLIAETEPEHVDYPHNPGWLDSCNACTDGPCMCKPGTSECVSSEHGTEL